MPRGDRYVGFGQRDLALAPVDEDITQMGAFLRSEIAAGRGYLPSGEHILRAFQRPLADVKVLADALTAWYRSRSRDLLDRYSDLCLRRVWRAEQFSAWMTALLHRDPAGDPFEHKLRLSYLRYVTQSEAAATTLAENYVGFEGA